MFWPAIEGGVRELVGQKQNKTISNTKDGILFYQRFPPLILDLPKYAKKTQTNTKNALFWKKTAVKVGGTKNI